MNNQYYQDQVSKLGVLFTNTNLSNESAVPQDYDEDYDLGIEAYDASIIEHAANAVPEGIGNVVNVDPIEELDEVDLPTDTFVTPREVSLEQAGEVIGEALLSLEQQRSTFAELYGAWDRMTHIKSIDRHFAQQVESISPGILTNLTHLNSFTKVRSKTNFDLAKRVLEAEINNISGRLQYERLATLHAVVGLARSSVEKGIYFNSDKIVDEDWHCRFRSTIQDVADAIKTADPTLNPLTNNLHKMDKAEIALRKFVELTA